ncbi:MAG: relaxase/mobilization nuclease domain-containing protein [Ruminococcus sp.]|nr:relaxase/mobilization nuclease domain-containing protein [Ruminococcus sp.]MCH5299383.1 relaxase/mobilization nuclease domain-containing protein [Ruminococcus sp.]
MAIFTAISNKTQSAVAMKRVLDYVMQDYKTMFYDELTELSYKLVSGQNCVPESAYSEFMTTKHRYNKAKGVFFKQYVQSFKPDCGATPQQIHQIGVEMAKTFDGFEVVIATHIDRDHWHNHLVVNSVNSETGLKIQINEKGLEQLRKKSDEICRQFGLDVLKPYQKPKQRTMNQCQYRTALRGNSKKLQLMNAIDYAVINSRSKENFIENMKRLGYVVKWIDSYKYITYTTPDGQRFRDNRLFGDKYLKENMEDLYGLKPITTNESNTDNNRPNSECFDRTDSAKVFNVETGAVQPAGGAYIDDWGRHCAKYGFDSKAAHTGRIGESDYQRGTVLDEQYSGFGTERNELCEIFNGATVEESDEQYAEDIWFGALGTENGVADSDTNESEEVPVWSDIAYGAVNLAVDLAMIIDNEVEDDNRQKKQIVERKNRPKSRPKSGFKMKM